MSHEIETKPDELLEESHDRFDKAIVVSIVLTALVAAITGLGQMRALQRHDAAIARSDQAAALASQASFTWNSIAQLQIDRFRLVQDARDHAEQASADARLEVGPPAATSRLQARQWGNLSRTLQQGSVALATGAGGFAGRNGMVAQSEQLTEGATSQLSSTGLSKRQRCPGVPAGRNVAPAPGPLTEFGPDGPARDSSFPTRYLADTRRAAYVLQAQGLLASEHAEAEEKQFTRFGVSLTMFATAVFLFGFALSPYGKTHRHLYCTGAVLLVTGSSLWAVFALVNGPASAPATQVATAYADGRVAYEKGDQVHIALARRLFTCALDRDPEFGPAYTARALADNSITDPSDPTGGTSTELVNPRYTREARVDLNHATTLGTEDPTLPMVAGTDVFEAGLRDNRHAELEDGLRLEDKALRMLAGTTNERRLVSLLTEAVVSGPDDSGVAKARSAALLSTTSIIAFNIAEAELALGNIGASRRAYQSAVALANAQARQGGGWAGDYAPSALTDLNDLQEHLKSASMQSEIRYEKGYIAHQFDVGNPDTRSHDGSGMELARQLTVVPAMAQFSITKLGNADAYDVDDQWYFRPNANVPWSAFVGLDGPQYPLHPNGTGYVADDGYWSNLSLNNTCLPSGDYKVEVYVDGHMAGSRQATIGIVRTQPVTLQDMGVALCAPSTRRGLAWSELEPRRVASGPTRIPGLEDGYLSPGGGQGILVFDVSPESDRERCSKGLNQQFIGRVLRQFAGSLPNHLSLLSTIPFRFLGGSENTSASLYSYPGGFLAASAGATAQNRVVVAAVFGPPWLFGRHTDLTSRARIEVPVAQSLLGSVESSEGAAYPDSCS